MAATAPPSYDEIYRKLHPDESAAPPAATPDPAAPPAGVPSYDQIYQTLYPHQTHTTPPTQPPPRTSFMAPGQHAAPVLPPIGGPQGAPPPPGALTPGSGPSIGPPRPAGPPNYARDRQTISATIADLNRQKPDLDREQHALGLRFQKLEQTRQEIDKGAAIAHDHPLEWGEDRGIRLEIKRQEYESKRQQFQLDQAAAQQRARAYHEAVTRAQGEQARLNFAPATAVIPKAPTFTPAPFPEQQLFLQAEDQTRRTPPGVSAPGRWPAALQHQQMAAGRFHLAVQARMKEVQQLGPQLQAAADQLAPYQKKLKAGELSPADERRVVQAGSALAHQIKLYTNTLKEYTVQDQRAAKFLAARMAAGFLPHGGDKYPEELAAEQGHPAGWIEQNVPWVGRLIQKGEDLLVQGLSPQQVAAKKDARARLGVMMVTGEDPPLPPNPGKTPLERKQFIDFKNQVRDYIKDWQEAEDVRTGRWAARNPGAPPLAPPDFAYLAGREAALGRTHWGRVLIQVLRAQSLAGAKAEDQAGVAGAGARDTRNLILGLLGGEAAGALVGGVLAKVPGVAALLSEPLFGAGGKAFLKGLGVRVGTRALTSAGGFTGFGATHAGVTAADQGQGLTGSLRAAARAVPPAAKLGAAVGAGEALVGVGAAALFPKLRAAFPGATPAPVTPETPRPPGFTQSIFQKPVTGDAQAVQQGFDQAFAAMDAREGAQGFTAPHEWQLPRPTTAADAQAQVEALQKFIAEAEAERAAAVAGGRNRAAVLEGAPKIARTLTAEGMKPGQAPVEPTPKAIVERAGKVIDNLKQRLAETSQLVEPLTQVEADVAAGRAKRADEAAAATAAQEAHIQTLTPSDPSLPVVPAARQSFRPGARLTTLEGGEIEILSAPDARGKVEAVVVQAHPAAPEVGFGTRLTLDLADMDHYAEILTPARPAPAAPVITVAPRTPTPAEAVQAETGGRPPSPGGYDQAPAGLDAGPAVTAPAGTPVPFRYQTPAVLAGLVNQLQQDGTPDSLAAIPVVQGYVVRAQQYDQGRQVPPQMLDQVTTAFKDPKEPAQIAFRIISRAASKARDPELAARLAAAAKGVQDDFGEFYLGTLPDAQSRDTGVDLAPPFVSPYRTLSGADRASLDPETRRALLIQDIVNSTRVLHPGTPPFFTVPGSVSQLQNQADNLFRQAQRQALQSEVAQATPAAPAPPPPAPAPPPPPSTVPGVTVPPTRFGDRAFQTQPSPVATEQRGKLSAPAPSLSRRHQAMVRALAAEGGASKAFLQRRFRLNRSEASAVFADLQGAGIIGRPGPNGRAPLLLSPRQVRELSPPRVTQQLQVAPRGPERTESLLAAAARRVADSGRATAPGIARRLGISPREAEALLKELQQLGVVSAPNSAGHRRVLMNHAQAEDAVSHAETLARRKAGGYVPVPTPAPNVKITHHAPKPKAPPKPQPKPVEKAAPAAEKPPPAAEQPAAPPPTPNPQAPTPAAKVRLRSKGGTVVDVENGRATYIEVAPGSSGEVGGGFRTTEERLKAKGWTEVKEQAEPATEKPQGSAPAPQPEGEAKPQPKAKEEEPRPRSAPSEPAPTPEPAAAEESHVLSLEQRLAALPESASFGDFLDALPEETRAAVSAEQPVAEEEALPPNVIFGQDAKGRLPSPSAAERPKELTAAKIAAVVKAGLDKVEAGQLVGVRDLKTQFTLTAPDPAKGPYAWTAQVTYRGLSPVLVGDPIFVNFANRPSNYVLNPPAPPVRAAASAVPKATPPDWAKIGARFEDDFQIRYELIGRDAEAGTWMGQKVHIPERKWVVTPQVGELNMFTDRGLHHFEPLPGEAAPPVAEGPRELTPVPVVEERNDELPTAPPVSTQVKQRGRQRLAPGEGWESGWPTEGPGLDLPPVGDQLMSGPLTPKERAAFLANDPKNSPIGMVLLDTRNSHLVRIVRHQKPAMGTATDNWGTRAPGAKPGTVYPLHGRDMEHYERVIQLPDYAEYQRLWREGFGRDLAQIAERLPGAAAEPQVTPLPGARKALPQATEPAAVTLPAEQLGKATRFTAENKKYAGQFAVVEAEQPVTSHDDSLVPNPVFPRKYQPRDRDELASQAQVIHLMQTWDPEMVGANVLASQGAMIVAPSLLVESGNGRMIAIRRLYRAQMEGAANYRTWLLENAEAFGLDPAVIETMKHPVLVRIRTEKLTEPERLAFVHAANARETLKPAAKASAKFLASRLTSRLMEHFDPGVDLNLNVEQNRTWVKGLLGLFGPNELPIEEKDTAFGKVAQLSPEGQLLAMNAVFYYAYGDEGLLATITSSAVDNPIKRVTGAMLQAAGRWSTWRDRIKEGHAYDLDVTPDLLAVVHRIYELRQRKLNPKKVAAPLFGDVPLTPLQEVIFQAIEDRKGSQPAIASFLADIADLALQVGDPFEDNNHPALFEAGEKELPTTREIVEAARRKKRSDDAGQAGLLPASEAGPGAAPGGDGPTARATSTGPLGGGNRQGGKPFRDLSALWVEAYPELSPYLHADAAFDLRDGLWFQARFGSGMPLIWNQRFAPPVEAVEWMAGDGHALRRRFDLLAHRLLTPAEQKQLGAVGLMVHPAMGGLNLTWSSGAQDIYANPFSRAGDTGNVYRGYGAAGNDPRTEARRIALAMVHEIAHFRVKEEGDKLWDEMDRMVGQVGLPAFRQLVAAITGVLTKGGKQGEFSPQYQKAREAYAAAVWAHRRLDFGGSVDPDAGGGPPHALPVQVRRGQGRAGKHQGRGPTGRATSVNPSGKPEPEFAYPEEGQEDQFLDARVENVRPAEPETYVSLLRQLMHDLTREFPELRAGGRYAQFHTLMHDAVHASARAKEEAKREIDRIFGPLSPAEKGLFERALYVYNLAENLTILKDRIKEGHQALTDEEAQAEADAAIRFPLGKDRETGEPKVVWTAENVRSTKALFMRRVANSDRVRKAIAERRQFVSGVGGDTIYWTQRATGRKIDLPREDYMHQMVLLYALGPDGLARLIASPTGGGKVKLVNRGFMKSRLVAGTTLAHNTSYVASELHWASQALADVVVMKLVADLGEREDLAHMVEAIAKAQNFELLMKRLDAQAEKLPLKALPHGEFRRITGEDLYRGMNVGIAQAFNKYGYMAAGDLLTREPSGRFDKLFEELADVYSFEAAEVDEGETYVSPKIDQHLKDGIFQYSQWILLESRRAGSPLPGAGPAGMLLRAVALRQKEIDAILGEDKTDADRVALTDPRFKGTSWWQAKPGRRIFSGLTLADRIGAELMEGLAEEAKITKDDLHTMPVLGGMNRRMLLPDPIKRTLETLDDYKSETALSKVLQETVRPVKFAQLYNPIHTADFFVRKSLNDLHALIYGGWPGTMKEQMIPATKLVVLYVTKGKIPSEAVTETTEETASGTRRTVVYDDAWRAREFRHFLRFGALHMRYEMMGIDTETEAAQIEMATKVGAYLATGLRGLAGAGKMARTIFSFWGPEAISILDGSMRFAAYLAAMQEMAASPRNRPKNVGFAHEQEVKAVEGMGKTNGEQILDQRRRRAWLMADEMMVAYDKSPPAVGWLANHGFAIWLRWGTQNTRRIYRLLANPAWEADAAEKVWTTLVDKAQVQLLAEVAATGGKGPPRLPRDPSPPGEGGGGDGGGGEGKGPPDAPDLPLPYPKSFRVGANQAMLALSLYVIPRIYQYARAFLDPESERDLPPEVRKDAHAILGHDPMTGKAMVWVRLSALDDVLAISDPWGVTEKYFQGKLTGRQALMEMVLYNPLKEMLQLGGPYQEVVDVLKRENAFPDPLNPKYQEVTTGRVLDVLGYGNMWRWATNQQRLAPSERLFKLAGVHEYGRLESNYYEVRDMARDTNGAPSSPGGAKSAKSAALYQFVQAAKAGDKKGAGYYLLLYQLKGGTPNGIRESVRDHDPLLGMNDDQAQVFMRTLDAGDRQKVRGAYLHYRHEVDMIAGQPQTVAFPRIDDDMAWLVSARQEIRSALRQANPIETLSTAHPENAAAVEAAKAEREAAKHPQVPAGVR